MLWIDVWVNSVLCLWIQWIREIISRLKQNSGDFSPSSSQSMKPSGNTNVRPLKISEILIVRESTSQKLGPLVLFNKNWILSISWIEMKEPRILLSLSASAFSVSWLYSLLVVLAMLFLHDLLYWFTVHSRHFHLVTTKGFRRNRKTAPMFENRDMCPGVSTGWNFPSFFQILPKMFWH